MKKAFQTRKFANGVKITLTLDTKESDEYPYSIALWRPEMGGFETRLYSNLEAARIGFNDQSDSINSLIIESKSHYIFQEA